MPFFFASLNSRVDTFLQQIVNGLTLGCVYAVVALGYTMVYGIIQLINFAHGEVVMIGCMVAFSVIVALAGSGLPPIAIVGIGILAAVPICMAVGYVVERVAYRPLRNAPRLAPLITAIGVSIVLHHLALLVGAATHRVPADHSSSSTTRKLGKQRPISNIQSPSSSRRSR